MQVPPSLYLVKMCPFIITVFPCASVHMYLCSPALEETHILYTVTICCQINWVDLFGKVSKFRSMIRAEHTPVKAMLCMQNRLCID